MTTPYYLELDPLDVEPSNYLSNRPFFEWLVKKDKIGKLDGYIHKDISDYLLETTDYIPGYYLIRTEDRKALASIHRFFFYCKLNKD